MSAALAITLGLGAGLIEALSLRRSARREASALAVLARLALVAGTLTLAALGGQLLAAALAWACALFLTGAALLWRWS